MVGAPKRLIRVRWPLKPAKAVVGRVVNPRKPGNPHTTKGDNAGVTQIVDVRGHPSTMIPTGRGRGEKEEKRKEKSCGKRENQKEKKKTCSSQR